MVTRKLVLAFCVIRLMLGAVLAAAGTPDSLAENVTLRVMCAALGGSRDNRKSEQNGGLSAALEAARSEAAGADAASESSV